VRASQKDQQSDVNPKSYPEYIRTHEPQNIFARALLSKEGVAAAAKQRRRRRQSEFCTEVWSGLSRQRSLYSFASVSGSGLRDHYLRLSFGSVIEKR
jgi:hypothetical protein